MDKFTKLTAFAAPSADRQRRHRHDHPQGLSQDDQAHRLGSGLFAEMRYKDDGSENPDFVLKASGLSQCADPGGGRQLRCGSSREHAPGPLLDFGIRCVISTSFADIFYNNCFKNGILPVNRQPGRPREAAGRRRSWFNATLTVDLEAMEIRGPDGGVITFDIDDFKRPLPAQRPRRHRPDAREGAVHRQLRDKERRASPLGLTPGC